MFKLVSEFKPTGDQPYGILFGVIELVLIWLSIYFFPAIGILMIAMFFIFLIYLEKSRRQYVTIDPFQIVRTIIINDRTPGNSLYEKREQYFYITIYGDIEYREKYYDMATEKYKKINHIKIYRGLKYENEFIKALKQKI